MSFCLGGEFCKGILFVICIERLSHLIQLAVEHGVWNPVSISRGGPPITHLCFVDDLFIFAEASLDQVDIIKNYLDTFELSFGQKISLEKTKKIFSHNVHHSRASDIARQFSFSLTRDLGKYLGVLLQHNRASSRTFKHVTDRLLQRLSSWKANSLSLTRRITLCSSVLATTPLYLMQTAKLPNPICDKIDGVSKNFLWGATDGNSKMPLSNWDNVCRHKGASGLGL